MKTAPLPANETARLASLREHHVLDTAPSELFDNLVHLAAQICEVPVAAISLLDADRVWMKACTGIQATECKRDISFCAHTILQSAPLIVADATSDSRFYDNPAVVGESHLRFYAGVPLVSEDGFALGALCVVDSSPRHLSEQQLDALGRLGRQAASQLTAVRRGVEMNRLNAERACVEAKRAQLAAIVEFSADAIYGIDLAGYITSWNLGAEELFGYTAAEMIGKQEAVLSRSAGDGLSQLLQDAILHGQSLKIETVRVKKSGGLVHVMLTLAVIYSTTGEPVGISAIGRDITERIKQQDAVRESEAYFRRLFDQAAIGMCIVDLDGKFLSANEGFCRLLGYTEQELQSRNIVSVSLPSDAKESLVRLEQLMVGAAQSFTVEKQYVTKSGEIIWCIATVAVLRNQGKGAIQFIGQIQDISALKRAEVEAVANRVMLEKAYADIAAKVEQLNVIFENSPIGKFLVGLDGQIVRVNKAAADLLGYSSDELSRMNVHELIFLDDSDPAPFNLADFVSGITDSHGVEQRCRHKAGHTVWAMLGVSVIPDSTGHPHQIVIQLVDITANKFSADLIREQAASLQRSNNDLQQFANIASHDLQEPLRTITSFVQLIDKHYQDVLDEDGKEWMNYVVEGTTRMQQLINDLLAYSRVGSSRKDKTFTDVGKVFQEVKSDLRVAIERSDAQVMASKLPCVMADEVQLRQLLQNLIGNAIKYCGSNVPSVSVEAQRRQDFWTFSIRDNGIGMESQYFERVFKIFQRLHTRRAYDGTGMGLAICKRIVEGHGGTIWVESLPDQGSTFSFTLPTAMEN